MITKELLDERYLQTFDMERFLKVDPLGIVYELRGHTPNQLDLEIGALLTATITWGNRVAIRKAVRHMLAEEMQWQPARFILEERYEGSYVDAKNGCVYRTLNVLKFKAICRNLHLALRNYAVSHPDVSPTLEACLHGKSIDGCIQTLTEWLAPAKLGTLGKTACKRICMYLRWMVRTDKPDLGLWKSRRPSELYAVMDVHVCQLTQDLIRHNRQASWTACLELTEIFRGWDPIDPLHYDIALMTVADRP